MKRFYEIDFWKGLAVIAMVIFHYFYIGTEFNVLNYNTNEGILYLLSKFAHLTFIFMVGVNLFVKRQQYKTEEEYRESQYKRVLFIISLAIFISFSTYLIIPDNWVKFGILHFIACSILILIPFVDKPNISLIFGLIVAFIYQLNEMKLLDNLHEYIPEELAFILGLYNYKFNAMDHFSLLKYLPIMSLGIFVGNQIYKKDNRKLKEFNKIDKYISGDNLIVKIGQHSLSIYVIHLIILFMYFK